MEKKLYVKVKCSICLGKRNTCFYCDPDSLTYIEASDKLLKEWFLSQSEDRKKELTALFHISLVE